MSHAPEHGHGSPPDAAANAQLHAVAEPAAPGDLIEYLEALSRTTSLDKVWQMHCAAMAAFGFDRLLYGYSKFVTDNSLGAFEDTIFLSNHSARYFNWFIRDKKFLHAPLFRWARDNIGVASWGAIWSDREHLSDQEREVVAFNKRNKVTAGYSIRFADPSPRDFGIMALAAHEGLDQADVDAIWDARGREINVMNQMLHLKIISLPHNRLREKLSQRQREVLGWVAEGKSTQDIAEILGVTPPTVEKHKRLAREKLGVETTAQALLKSAYYNQIFTR